MSASPAKRAAEDVSPGVRTPTDVSPETSAGTPSGVEERGRRKRGRAAKTDDGTGTRGGVSRDGGRDSTSTGVRREVTREARSRAMKIELREIAGGMVDAMSGKRRGGCVRGRVAKAAYSKSDRRNARRDATRDAVRSKTDDESRVRVRYRSLDGDARTRALLNELTRVERYETRTPTRTPTPTPFCFYRRATDARLFSLERSELMEMEDDDDPCAASLLTYARFIRRKSTAKVTLDDINEDTLHSILSRVDVESPRELLALSVVSKRFRDALRSSTVWHTLDLKAHGAQMTNKILYGIIKDDDAFASIETLRLAGCVQLTDLSVIKVLNKCRRTVREIDLTGCELLTVETARFIAANCKKVERLYFTNCKRVPTTYVLKSIIQSASSPLVDVRINGTKHLNGRVDEYDFEELLVVIKEYVDWLHSFDGTMFEQGDVDDCVDVALTCEKHLQKWRAAVGENAVTLCNHASDLQDNVERRKDRVCTLFPDCGHVQCVECQDKERRNMFRNNGAYVYPCPGCLNRSPLRCMPAPGGFEIAVHAPEAFRRRQAERRDARA